MKLFKIIYRRVRHYYNKIIRIRATPHEIALGFALGIFIGLTPTMGIQMVIVIPLAYLLKVSEVSAVIGVWITNPWTAVPLYFFNYRLGALIVDITPLHLNVLMSLLKNVIKDITIIKTMGVHIGAAFIGGAITGIVLGTIGYILCKQSVINFRKRIFIKRSKEDSEK